MRSPLRALALILSISTLVANAFPDQVTFEPSLEDDIIHASRNVKNCASCQALLIPFKRLASLGDDRFVAAITRICKMRKLADPEICEKDLAMQGPIIAHDLRSISIRGRTSQLLCSTLYGLCNPIPVEPFNVTLPPQSKSLTRRLAETQRSKARTRQKPFQVVHLSDVHIDREYSVGSEANCTKYICCHTEDEDPGSVQVPALPFGNKKCDTPTRLADSMLEGIRQFAPDALFTISSGDVVDHTNWVKTPDVVQDDLHGFHQQLVHGLAHPFYGSLGNHDTSPTNNFARVSSEEFEDHQWLYDFLGEEWGVWLGDDGAAEARHFSGSYAVVHPGTNLRLISLNTQYWYKYNFWLYDSDEFQPDPNGILEFLVSELYTAEQAGQRAWIFGHIPPGSADTLKDQSNYFNQIIRRFKDTIAVQFYGHTHIDQFQIAYSDYGDQVAENAISYALVAPSLTPTNGHPAFTVYDVDPQTYEIMDARVYIANMSESDYHIKPKWSFLYSARESYGPLVAAAFPANFSASPDSPSLSSLSGSSHTLDPTASLDASFWHYLTEVFVTNDTAFEVYINRTTRNAGTRPCRETCKDKTICDLRAMRSEDNCFHSSLEKIVFPDPDDPQHLEESEVCEGSSFMSIMRNLLKSVRSVDDIDR